MIHGLAAALCAASLFASSIDLAAASIHRVGATRQAVSIDLIIIQDDSGSMWRSTEEGPASDPAPGTLRVQAAKLAIELAGADVSGADDRIGFVAFGDELNPRNVQHIPLTRIDSEIARETMSAAIEELTYDKGWTSFEAALRRAIQVAEEGDAAYRTPPFRTEGREMGFLFLSDGRPQTFSNELDTAQLERLRGDSGIYAQLRSRGWKVFAVGLGLSSRPGPYQDVMLELANSTNGRYFPARNAEELLPIYAQVASELGGGVQRGPLTLAGEHVEEFLIPDQIQLATFNILKSHAGVTARVIGPDNRELRVDGTDAVRRVGTRFESVTVQEPVSGLWQVVLDGTGTVFVNLISRPRVSLTASPTPISQPPTATVVVPTVVPVVATPEMVPTSSSPVGNDQPNFLVSAGVVLSLVAAALFFGYLLLLRATAGRSGPKIVGSREETGFAWTDLDWGFLRNPLLPRVSLATVLESLGTTRPELDSMIVFTRAGSELRAADSDQVLLNNQTVGRERCRLSPGDQISGEGWAVEIVSFEMPAATEASEEEA